MNAARFDGVDLAEQLGGELDPAGAGALKATVFGGQAFESGSLRSGDGVETGLTEFTAAEDPAAVEFPSGAPTGGFAAFGAEPVEGAWDHGEGSLETMEQASEAAVIGPEFLAEFGERHGHVYI